MYATLPFARLTKVLVWTFILVAAAIWLLRGKPATPGDILKVASLGVTVTGLVLLIVFAPTGRLSPWRLLWRAIPAMNAAVFPDLNGTWDGTQESNWSKIDAMRKAACQKGALSADFLDAVGLMSLPITLEIKASLFELHVYAILPKTESTSVSAASRLIRSQDGRYILYYVFTQETGLISSTDESVHDGAARLIFYPDQNELSGTYWTKRMWQAGLNTAGRLKVTRVDRNRRRFR
jgi:hypothetical protein